MKFLKISIVFWASLYVIGLVFIYLFQARLVFSPTVLKADHKFEFQSPFEEHFLESDTEHKIHYLKFKREKPNSVVLYFHGNGGALNTWGYMAEKIAARTNAEVWMIDYPGYGKSSKGFARSGRELIKLGQQMLDQVNREHTDLPVVLYGRSLGTGIASALSSDSSVAGLVLETPYYTTTQLAKEMFPVVPSFIFKYNLENTKIKNTKLRKVLILHGDEDGVIPFEHARKLKKEFSDLVHLVKIIDGSHNDLPNYEMYWTTLKAYLAKVSKQ